MNKRIFSLFLLIALLLAGAAAETFSTDDDWMLILVNRYHPILEDYEIDLVEVRGGQKIDRRILEPMNEMFNAARADGISPKVRSGYRTIEKQEQLLQDKYEYFLKKGYTENGAREKALEWVAYPRTSEHHLGICADINGTGDTSDADVYAWLAKNAWKYGFILRYPEDKTLVTGVMYEPWHYRYVGKEAAKEIYEQGITLEEYLGEK